MKITDDTTMLHNSSRLGFCLGVVLLVATLMSQSTSLYAHGKEENNRAVNIRLHVTALPRTFSIDETQTLKLSHAYLSTFSVQFFPCNKISDYSLENNNPKWLDWFISSAYANHGVRFTKPTQIPIRKHVNLLESNTAEVGEFMLPIGHYCEMNFTIAHPGGKATQTPIKDLGRYSVYVAGIVDEREVSIQSTYAYGKNIPINISIQRPTAGSNATQNLHIYVDAKPALSSVDFTLPNHKMARQLFLALPNQVSVKTDN